MRQAFAIIVDTDAAARLAHVRDFLEKVDRHFPEGIPLEYSAAIRAELQPLENAVVADVVAELTEPAAARAGVAICKSCGEPFDLSEQHDCLRIVGTC